MFAEHGNGLVWLCASLLPAFAGCATGVDLPADLPNYHVPDGGSGGPNGGTGGSGGSTPSNTGLAGGGVAPGTGGNPDAVTSTGGVNNAAGGSGRNSGGESGNSSTGGMQDSGSAPRPNDAGASPGQTLFVDDFEGASTGWTPATDGWSVASDDTKVYRQGTLDSQFRVSSAGGTGWADQVVEARVKVLEFVGSSTSNLAGVYARFKDPDNHYYVALQADGHLKIKKKTGGNNTSISSQAAMTIATKVWYTIKLEVIGTTLNAYVDGSRVLTATDSDVLTGGVAVGTKNATAEFDDVRVTAP